MLKEQMWCRGSSKDGEIIIQGEFRERIVDL